MNRHMRRAVVSNVRKKGAFNEDFVKVPRQEWPSEYHEQTNRVAVWIGRTYLVQVFDDGHGGILRLSINKTIPQPNGDWVDGIGWEELQAIKDGCGYADYDAVEIYPRQIDVVNVANMRHLWVLPHGLSFAWRKAK